MNGRCVYCDAERAVERHHITGRIAADGAYLDPELTLTLCIPCHHGDHACWRTLDIETGGDAVTALTRVAFTFARLGDRKEPTVLAPQWCRLLGSSIGRAADEIGGRP